MAKGNKKGFLSTEDQKKIARYKGRHPLYTLRQIAERFKVTERQVFNSVHKYAELSGIKKRDFTDKAYLKKIALWKASHPKCTLEELEKKFKVPTYVARYALQKFAELSEVAELMTATKKGRSILSEFTADEIDQVNLLKKQLNYCLAEIENNKSLVLSSRIDLLYKAMRIRVHLQQVEIESHLKRADALLIARIVRRFKPDATDEDVIKIYTEELMKLKEQNGVV